MLWLPGMRRQTSEALAEYESELRRELSDTGPIVLDLLRKIELEVSRIKRGAGPPGIAPWLLQARPAAHIAQAFELARLARPRQRDTGP
jgi:hypothetical protein